MKTISNMEKEDFTKKAIKVDDVSKKEIEVTNFPESIEVHGKVETDFKPPKDRFSEYSSLIKNLQENIQRNIVEYRVIAPILEAIRDKDTKPVVNLSNDFGKVEKYLSEIDEKVAKLVLEEFISSEIEKLEEFISSEIEKDRKKLVSDINNTLKESIENNESVSKVIEKIDIKVFDVDESYAIRIDMVDMVNSELSKAREEGFQKAVTQIMKDYGEIFNDGCGCCSKKLLNDELSKLRQ